MKKLLLDNTFLEVNKVARFLNVSKRTVQREIKRGSLKAQKAGRKFIISTENLNRYLERSTKKSDDQLSEFLLSKKEEMITFLHKLVTIPSFESGENDNETLAKTIHCKLDSLNIRNYILGSGDSLALRASLGFGRRGILLDCPLDTASIGDLKKWSYPPFGGIIKQGKIYGRGSADAKGGIVSIIYALVALKEYSDENKIRVEVVFDGGEHDGEFLGMRNVLKKGIDADAAIIGYANDSRYGNEVGIGCRGYHRYSIKTIGKTSHTGSRYDYGVNAISKMAKFIHQCEKQKFPSPRESLFPFGSKLTFCKIQGGRAINIVPDECEASIDVRTLPSQGERDVKNYLEKIYKNLKRKDKEFSIKLKYITGQDGYALDKEERIIKSIEESIKIVLKRKADLEMHGASHIGTLLYKHKIPTIVWGPKGDNFHSYDEYLEIDSLPKAAEVYARTINQYFHP